MDTQAVALRSVLRVRAAVVGEPMQLQQAQAARAAFPEAAGAAVAHLSTQALPVLAAQEAAA
jgi:hypothetical protein